MGKRMNSNAIKYGRTIEFSNYNLVEVNLGEGYSARHKNLGKLDRRYVLFRSSQGDFMGFMDIPHYFQGGFALEGVSGRKGSIYFSCEEVISVFEKRPKS